MKKDKVLVTGAAGQLGSTIKEITKEFPHYEFLFTDKEELDISSREQVEEYLIKHSPNWIINAAAYSDVDLAQSEPDKVMEINGKAVEILAQEAEVIGAGLVQISSNYVFAGENPDALKETAAKAPISAYGKSKLAGEKAAKKASQHIIIRTGWLYSPYGKNFVKTIRELAAQNSELEVVGDQWSSPTSAHDLARAILTMIENPIYGTFNYTNEGVASWAMFAEEIVALSGLDCYIKHISTDQYPSAARRPEFSILSKDKIKKEYGLNIKDWELSLEEMIEGLGDSAMIG